MANNNKQNLAAVTTNSETEAQILDEELELEDLDEYVEETYDELWLTVDEIKSREYGDGSIRTWIKARYQATEDGVPKKVINVFGIDRREARKLQTFCKKNPFTLVSVLGFFAVKEDVVLPDGTPGNPIESLSNCIINTDEDGSQVTKVLDRSKVVKTRYASRLTKLELAQRKAKQKPVQISGAPTRNVTELETVDESVPAEQQNEVLEVKEEEEV